MGGRRASRCRRRTSTRSGPARRSADARGAAWCAATLADELRRRRPRRRRAAGPSSTWSSSASARTATSCRSSRARAAFDAGELALAIPAPDPHRAARRAGDAQPGRPRRRPRRARSSPAARRRRAVLADIFGADARSGAAGRPSSPAAPARPGSSTARPRRASRADRWPTGALAPGRLRRRDADRRLHAPATARRSSSSTARPPTTRRSGSSARGWPRWFTVHAIDRRGRGASGDTPPYAIEREFEDVAAVAEALAAETGRPGPGVRPLLRRALRARARRC